MENAIHVHFTSSISEYVLSTIIASRVRVVISQELSTSGLGDRWFLGFVDVVPMPGTKDSSRGH